MGPRRLRKPGLPSPGGRPLQSPCAPALVLRKYGGGPGTWGARRAGEPWGPAARNPEPQPPSRTFLPPAPRPPRPLPLSAGEGPIPAPPPGPDLPPADAGPRPGCAAQTAPEPEPAAPRSPGRRGGARARGARLGAQAPPAGPSPRRSACCRGSVWSPGAGAGASRAPRAARAGVGEAHRWPDTFPVEHGGGEEAEAAVPRTPFSE